MDNLQLAQAMMAQAIALMGGDGSQQMSQAMPWHPTYKALAQKAVSSTPATGVWGHGNGGLFSYPGMERPVFSAMTLPYLGLQSILPVRPNNSDNPVYGIFTGVTATSGSEPTGVCDDPPTVGLSKLCKHTFVWGRQSRQTQVYDLDRFGHVVNRSDFQDFQLLGNPFSAPPQNPNVPTMPGAAGPSNALNSDIAKAFFEFAVGWARDFAKELYSGNPTNNTAGGGRKYFYGLDILINTGYRDAETGTACAAADSLVRSFGDLRVDSNQTAIVNTLTYMYRNLDYIAERAGLKPAEWAIVMRYGAFYEITAVWPIAYNTYRNTMTDSGQTVYNNGGELTRMRDEMRNGRYLLIDGMKIPVILDEAIAETEPAAGVFESSIYFVPLRVLGNTPVTFFEHLNYDIAGGAMDAARMLAPADTFYTTDSGRFFWIKKPPANYCVQVQAKTEPRLLLLTPHIAGRLTDVRYSPLIHERGTFTDDPYYVNGGGTSRLGYSPSLYSPTA